MSEIDFYFDYRSPYSYLALTQLGDLDLTLRPFDVIDVMKRVGNRPTTITCKVKGQYAAADLGRWSARYRVPLERNPQMGEVDGRRLLRATLAIPDGPARRKAVAALFDAMWGTPEPLVTASDIAATLAAAGIDGATALAAQIDGDDLEAHLDEANAAAAARGVFGSPTFTVGDQMFFGNDRLDFLREALAVQA